MKTLQGVQLDATRTVPPAAKALLDALPDRACLLDQHGVVIAVNGKPSDQDTVVGVDYAAAAEIFAGLSGADLTSALRGIRAVADGSQSCFELEFSCPGGSRWCRLRATPVPLPGAAVLVIHEDVSHRRNSEHALRQAIEDRAQELARVRRFQDQLTEYLPDGVIYIASDGSLLGANRQGHRSLNMSIDELKSLKLADFAARVTHEDGSPCPVDDYPASRCLATGQPQRPAIIGVLQTDGSRRWLLVSAVPVPCPIYEKRTGALATFLDVTDRKRAEEELRQGRAELERRVQDRTVELQRAIDRLSESESRFRQMAENIGEVVWIIQIAPREMLYISPTYEKVYGRSAAEMYADPRSFTRSVVTEDVPRVLESITISMRRPVDTVYRITLPSGELRWIRSRASPVYDETGAVYRITGIAEDITDIQRAQEALTDLQQQVLAVTERERQRIGQDLHDGLGQHLAGIGFLSTSLHRRLADKAAGGTAPVATEAADAAHVASLVQSAIVQSRALARGLQPVGPTPGGLASALHELVTRIEAVFLIPCTFECETPVPVDDDVVANHLYRVAQEALNNATKYAQAESIRVELAAAAGQISLSVADDGVGLPPTAERRAGMGLGIMRYRAHLIGATLHVGPNAPRGTVVRCLLPPRTGEGR